MQRYPYILEKGLCYQATSFGEHATPNEIFSTMSGLVEISILMVGVIFDMLPSSNVSGAGMGFLNQSTFLAQMLF